MFTLLFSICVIVYLFVHNHISHALDLRQLSYTKINISDIPDLRINSSCFQLDKPLTEHEEALLNQQKEDIVEEMNQYKIIYQQEDDKLEPRNDLIEELEKGIALRNVYLLKVEYLLKRNEKLKKEYNGTNAANGTGTTNKTDEIDLSYWSEEWTTPLQLYETTIEEETEETTLASDEPTTQQMDEADAVEEEQTSGQEEGNESATDSETDTETVMDSSETTTEM